MDHVLKKSLKLKTTLAYEYNSYSVIKIHVGQSNRS